MKKTLSTYEAAELLAADDNANWSRAGAFALVEHLEQIEDDTGEEIEFDAVAIRCDYSQFDDLETWAKEYFGTDYLLEACEAMSIDEDIATSDDPDMIADAIREYIRDRGDLVEFDGGVIVNSF